MNIAEEIRKLKELMDSGIITSDEFEAQKWRLLHSGDPDPKRLICPNCGSHNITVQPVQNVFTQNRGCLNWLAWGILALFTFGLILLIPLFSNTKIQSVTTTEAICQNCGSRWRLGKSDRRIWPYIVIGIIIWLIIVQLRWIIASL